MTTTPSMPAVPSPFDLPAEIAAALPNWPSGDRDELEHFIAAEAAAVLGRQAPDWAIDFADTTATIQRALLGRVVERVATLDAASVTPDGSVDPDDRSTDSIKLALLVADVVPFLAHDEQRLVVRAAHAALERVVGRTLTRGLSEELMDEFQSLAEGSQSRLQSWLKAHIPDYRERDEFLSLVAQRPRSSKRDVLSEYATKCWLELNRPHYRVVVKQSVAPVLAALSDLIRTEGADAVQAWARVNRLMNDLDARVLASDAEGGK